MPIDYARRLEAARLAAGQCAGDAHKFKNLAEAIYAFLNQDAAGPAKAPAPTDDQG